MQLSLKMIPKKYHHFIAEVYNSGGEISVDIKEGYVGSDGLHEWIMDAVYWEYYTQKEVYDDLNNFLSTVKPE